MSYHVLARKWRPQTFADLVGQTHVVKALTFALSQNQIHHAYLFTGTRGVGKTSIARIFAKSLNCQTNGVSPNPCGRCENCREIKSGKFVDLIEVDAASRTGVDETRELIDSVAYMPTKGRYKVYLIDEVHMFSKSSFNALLKTLEEPPAHVKFILATTDPEKLPITILSRCLQFNLKSLTQAQIKQHLVNICEGESIRYDATALDLLAAAGDGSMRDTLSMTDQAIAYGHGELSISAVTEILGTIHPTDIESILFAIATNNPAQLNNALRRLDDYEIDARAFLIEIMRRLQQMAWAKEGIINDLSPTLLSTIVDIPKPLLHLWYDIAEKALPNLAVAGDAQAAVEMTLLRMLAFIPIDWVPRHRSPIEVHDSADDAGKNKTGNKASVTPPAADSDTTGTAALTAETGNNSDKTPVQEAPTVQEDTPVQQAPPVKQDPSVQQDVGDDSPPWQATPVQATSIQAMPVTTQDSLEDAEANFSNTSAAMTETENRPPSPITDALVMPPVTDDVVSAAANINTPTAEQPTPSADIDTSTAEPAIAEIPKDDLPKADPPADATKADMQLSSDAWYLDTAAADTHETPVDMAQVNAMMQRGSDLKIQQPPKSQQPPESAPADVSETYPAAAKHTDDNNNDNDAAALTVAKVTDNAKITGAANANQPGNYVPKSTDDTSLSADTQAKADLSTFDWFQAINELELSDYTRHFVSQGILHLDKSSGKITATLDLPPLNEVLATPQSRQEMQQALQNYLASPITFSINLTEINTPTPAEIEQTKTAQLQAELLQTFQQHPITARIVDELGGRVITKTVKKK